MPNPNETQPKNPLADEMFDNPRLIREPVTNPTEDQIQEHILTYVRQFPVPRMLDARVLILQDQADAITRAGIIIPDTAKEKPARGTVIAIGTGTVYDNGVFRPMLVAQGDVVIYGKYAGDILIHQGQEYRMVRDSDIFAIVGQLTP